MKKTATTILAAATAAAAMFFAGRGCRDGGGHNEGGYTETRVDTLIVRDTLRDTVLVPVECFVVRVDTVWLQAGRDTVRIVAAQDSVRIAVPIERKVYATRDYRAVVEGFRPALVEMELYPKTTFITRETLRAKAPEKWSIGIQAGWGISPKGAAGYIGVGVQYRILVW